MLYHNTELSVAKCEHRPTVPNVMNKPTPVRNFVNFNLSPL